MTGSCGACGGYDVEEGATRHCGGDLAELGARLHDDSQQRMMESRVYLLFNE